MTLKKSLSGLEIKLETTARLMENNINNIMFFLVISIALSLKLFFRKRYNFAEYTSIGFFIAGAYTIFKIFTMIIGKMTYLNVDMVELVVLVLLIFYGALSFFQNSKFGYIIKYALMSLFSLVSYTILALVFFFLIVLLK
jgi:uncharacterized MnhB-related membrane protein